MSTRAELPSTPAAACGSPSSRASGTARSAAPSSAMIRRAGPGAAPGLEGSASPEKVQRIHLAEGRRGGDLRPGLAPAAQRGRGGPALPWATGRRSPCATAWGPPPGPTGRPKPRPRGQSRSSAAPWTAPSWPTRHELHGLLNEAFEEAQRSVAVTMDDDETAAVNCHPSTTMVVALAATGQIVVGNVGDSRAYWLGQAADGRRLLTVDDTVAQELMAEGAPPDEAFGPPRSALHHPLDRRRRRVDRAPHHRPRSGRSWPAGRLHRRALELLRGPRAASAEMVDGAGGSTVAGDRPAADRRRPRGRRPGQHHRGRDPGRTAHGSSGRPNGGVTATMAEFRIECFQNEYLPTGGMLMNAVITVSGRRDSGRRPGRSSGAARGPGRSHHPRHLGVDEGGQDQTGQGGHGGGHRLPARRRPLRRGGRQPRGPDGLPCRRHRWPASTPATRHEAKQAVRRLEANGGTAIGSWITLTTELLQRPAGHPARDPADRRPQRERVARGARPGSAPGRGGLPVRLSWAWGPSWRWPS